MYFNQFSRCRPMVIVAFGVLMFTSACSVAGGAAEAKHDPKAAALLDKYVEVTGGAAAYDAIKTRVIQGEISLPVSGVTGTMLTVYERPNRFYSEIDTSAGRQRRGSNGKTVWMIERAHGPRILTGLERVLVLRDGTLDRFAHWRELAASVEYAGTEEIEGTACDKVVLTYKALGQEPGESPEDSPVTIYFNPETGLITQYATRISSPNMLATVTVVLDDYRKEGGILMPHTMTLKTDDIVRGVTKLTSVENNVPVPDFELPREIQELIVRGKK